MSCGTWVQLESSRFASGEGRNALITVVRKKSSLEADVVFPFQTPATNDFYEDGEKSYHNE